MNKNPLELFDEIFCIGSSEEKIKKIEKDLSDQGVKKTIQVQKIGITVNKVEDIFVGQGVNQAVLMIAKQVVEKNLESCLVIEENTKIKKCSEDIFLEIAIKSIKDRPWEIIRLSYNLCTHVEDHLNQISHNYIKFKPRKKMGYIYGTNMWAMSRAAAIKLLKEFSLCWNQKGNLVKSDESSEAVLLSPNIFGVWASLNMENYLYAPMVAYPLDEAGKNVYKENYKKWKKEAWIARNIIMPKV